MGKKFKDKVCFFIANALINILGSIGFLLCVYFFFHFDTIMERVLYISGTIIAVIALAYIIPIDKNY